MSDTCSSEAGGRPFSFGLDPQTLTIVATVVACTPFLIIILGPILLRRVGALVGWAILKKTEGRRALLVSLMDEENSKTTPESNADSKISSSDGWEKIQASSNEVKANPSEAKHKDWDGIIGFFHPFWYVIYAGKLSSNFGFTNSFFVDSAMLVVVVNEYYGPRLEQHRLDGHEPNVWFIQEITKLQKMKYFFELR